MEIQLTDHARRQLQERSISESDVLETVRNPDSIVEQSLQRFRAIRKIRKHSKTYLLVVVYETHGTHKEIVTAFLTSKIKKYL